MSKISSYFIFIFAPLVLLGVGCVTLSGTQSGTGSVGVFTSNDQGTSWASSSALPTPAGIKSISGANVSAFIEDPRDPSALYLTTRENGFFFSYKDATDWKQPAAPFTSGFTYDVAVHPFENCTLYATDGTKVYKSIDCARTWEEVYRESRPSVLVQSLAFDRFAPNRLLVAESSGDILQTFDAGITWNVLYRFSGRIANIRPDLLKKGVFYVITRDKGLWRSDDGGTSWKSLSGGLSAFSGGLEYRRFVQHPRTEGKLYWISKYGILFSTDFGETWHEIKLITPAGSVDIYGFAVNPSNDNEIYYTATIPASLRSTFYRSADGGVTWTTKKLPSGQIPVALRVHPLDPQKLFIGFTILPKKK